MSEVDIYLKNIKTNIKKIRLEKNITRPNLSALSGVPLRTIENIESDKLSTDPKITTLLKIADALEITINDLYL